jgi:hypothetical protein
MYVYPEGEVHRAISGDALFGRRHARSYALGFVCPNAFYRTPAARDSIALLYGANHNNGACSRAEYRLHVTSG